MEYLRRNLACELAPHGIRVLTLQTGGVRESIPSTYDASFRESITKLIEEKTMLNRAATVADVGNVAVFAASDLARSMTGTKLNITCGAEVD